MKFLFFICAILIKTSYTRSINFDKLQERNGITYAVNDNLYFGSFISARIQLYFNNFFGILKP